MNYDAATEKFIQHEVQLRLHSEKFILQDEKFQTALQHQDEKFSLALKHNDEKFTHICNQLNNKLNVIMGLCGTIFTIILVPIILHSLKLI